MSAYMVGNTHIAYLVKAAMWLANRGERYLGDGVAVPEEHTAHLVGQELMNENQASINARYPSHAETAPKFVMPAKTWSTFDPGQIIKAAMCYEYQACEHPGWGASFAKKFVNTVARKAALKLFDFNQFEWGCPELPATAAKPSAPQIPVPISF